MIYDYLIIGAGSAGSNIAYALKNAGMSVAIVDKEGIACGASGAAGAFLSPLPGKKNSYNTLVNTALNFSLNFYENLLPNSFIKKGVLRVPNDNFDDAKLKANELKYENLSIAGVDGYFYSDAAIVNPKEICLELTKDCDFFQLDVEELVYKDEHYYLDELKSKNVILAQGVNTPLVKYPYVEISPIFGVKIDVKSSSKVPFNIHKSISVSANKSDSTIAIGATQQNHSLLDASCDTTCDKCTFYIDTTEQDVKNLISQAKELIELNDIEVINVFKGARATIKSYFPVLGKVINYTASLETHPSIKKGTKIPSELLEYYPNLYTINALGSRGFVYGPYLAKILKEYLLDAQEIPKEVSLEKLFYKMARTTKTS